MTELIKLNDGSQDYILSDTGRTYDKGHEFIGSLQRAITGKANVTAVTVKDVYNLAWEFLPYNDAADGSIGLKTLEGLVFALVPLALTLHEYDVTESATVWLDPDGFRRRPVQGWGKQYWEVELSMREV